MSFIADLHIHSYLSRATSKHMNLENISKWAQIKGISVVSTGDFTHPLWFSEIRKKLEPCEDGLFTLKKEFSKNIQNEVPASCRNNIRFILSTEISGIYSKGGRVRKVHSLIFAPDFKTVSKINNELDTIGNLKADGRPILGLDTKKLLKIVLDSSEDAFLIPAHAWTPHFSVLGAKSGFDSLEECFEELTPHIFAIETGLSSDPEMNWRLSALDNITLISNSDAHSLEKLGRETNVFKTELSYKGIKTAIEKGDKKTFLNTIEFFPEEGKYHHDGHRACNMRMSPKESKKNLNLCPKCMKKITIGVMHRVDQLADRENAIKPKKSPTYKSLIPLSEIISKVIGIGVKSKAVSLKYMALISALGNELDILQFTDINDIKMSSTSDIAKAVNMIREGNVDITPGYDGEYGEIKAFNP